jgi:trk system potassium uptake protein TrkA
MRVIICGAGQVGYGIAEKLASEKNDVSVIDVSPDLIRKVRDTLDVRGFVGHGSHPGVLEEAGAAEADMLIAVTLFDEVNMVACEVAHSLFNVPTKIARIRSQAYLQPHYMDLFSRDHMAIDVIISPELEVGEMVLKRIAMPGATDIVSFGDDRIAMVAIECMEECPIVDTPLKQLTELFPDLNATVVGVSRGGRLSVPRSADQLQAGDLAYVVAAKDHVRRTLGLFGHDEEEATRIVIAGGGNIGRYVARTIEERKGRTRVKIIEADGERAASAAEALERTVVLRGSALDQKILMEAGIDEADLMIALTNDDQVNILAGVLAKRLGCKSNMALLNNPAYHDFADSLGLDAFVNPRSATISRILQHVRRGRIRAVHSVEQGAAEVIEAEALETSPLVGRPLRDLELPEGMRFGAILRDGVALKPDGSVVIRPKDRAVIFARAEIVRQVEQMFRVSLEFF